ncbi:MAG: AMP-binding protein [Blastococcus sp.]|jgi:fatty-acyl-CoA synthase|nr:AMP-binding protein [Blastococcus sp.]
MAVAATVGAPPSDDVLAGLLRAAGQRYPDRPFVVDGDRRLTFAEADARVDVLASALLARGVGHGDPVALWLPNGVEWLLVALASFRIGAVLVPLNTRYKRAEAEQVLRASRATVLVLTDHRWNVDYYGAACEIVPELGGSTPGALDSAALPHLRHVVAAAAAGPLPGTTALDDLLAEPADLDAVSAAEAAVRTDDTVLVVYTSGTTGLPKGAMHSHVLIRNVRNIAREMHIEDGDRVLGHMPLYHIAGFCTAFVPALLQACTYYSAPQWEPDAAAALIEAERVSIFGGIPTHFIDLADSLERTPRDTSCLKSAWIGGANVSPAVAARAKEVLQLDALIAVYGMTETTSTTVMSKFEDPIELVCENKGLPVGDFEVAVFDPETGLARPQGQTGEVRVRGHIVTQGYYHAPEATAAAITEDGWFKTGDLGVFDERGYLKIVGRLKDMFIVGGTNAYPAEIEKHLEALPGVRQAVVVGVPHARLGEVGYAFVQSTDDTAPSTDDLLAACKKTLADYKVPRYVEFVDTFPMTSTGKLERHRLAAQAAASVTRPA